MKIIINNFSWFILFLAFWLLGQEALPQVSTLTLTENNNFEEKATQLEILAKESNFLWTRQALQTSIELYLNAAAQWKQAKNLDKVASCYYEVGKLQVVLGEKKEAILFFNDALKIFGDNQNLIEKAKVLSELSLLALADGKKNESEQFFGQALILANQTANSSAQASVFYNRGEFYYLYKDLPKSADFYQQSADSYRQASDARGEAAALLRLGYVYLDQNEYNTAFALLDKAMSKWQEVKDTRGQAQTLRAIGTVLNVANEKQKALDFYQKAEQLIPKDIDFFEQAGLSNGFGSIYEYYGDWQFSTIYRQKALDLFKKDKHLFGELATLSSLARLNALSGNDNLALDYFKQAESLAEEINDQFYLPIIQRDLGNFYLSKNNLEKAEETFQKSFLLLQRSKNQRQLSLITAKLGEIYKRKNNGLLARRYFSDSLKFNQRVQDKFSEAETLFSLASLETSENQIGTALKLTKKSVEITESLYSDVLNIRLKKTYFSSVYDRYELYINLLIKMHEHFPTNGYDIQALQASEKSRSRSLLETLRLSEANFTKDADPELAQKEKEIRTLLNLKADQLTELLSSNADKAETEALDNEINSLQNELEDIKGKLKTNSPIYSAIKNPPPFDIQDFQANVLDDKTLMLEFSFGAEESYLWLVGQNEVNHFTLPKREILESRIQKLLDLLKVREISENEEPAIYQKRLLDAEKEYDSEARVLSNELFGQIADKLAGKRLIMVPDGKLSYFPVSALPLPNAVDNTPMLETNEIIYEPSAATLQILGKTSRPEKLSAKELLVFADPIFSLDDNRFAAENKLPAAENDSLTFLRNNLRSFNLTDTKNQLKRLFATEEEAASIVKIIGASNSTIASGFAANRQRVFEKDVSDYKIIHFATHGLMNDTRPELSGIVLSLFDEKGEAQKGFIRLQDIYSLNLSADLVVLSACQSGIGKDIKGEGLMSLTSGFIQSGTSSVLSSLWKVDDYATAELMKNFYQELSTKNLAPSQALRNAQLKLRQNPNFKSPFYWAAFTVQGEFRHPISVKTNRFPYLWILLAAIFVGLVIYLCARKPAR